ncbi:hypothetical protein [Roseisolibacter agri]|uniref:Uncharacterized protein n=1 Tax=Roseisolibacter agri TaxID=2014610 RepID=A0AA37Q466_9BACT|nr:hypothetical protein [Roseisolibacter agri]GLC26240.1 hypothetical protein rosag_27530 [Roseisolibacter agri]
MDAHRRPDSLPARTRLARAPRRLRVIRGGGTGAPTAPRDVPAALASLLLPGLGQLIQGRRRPALVHAAIAAVLLAAWLLDPALRPVATMLLAACLLTSATDAARHRPRPPLRRA